jgi:hypothetical protein
MPNTYHMAGSRRYRHLRFYEDQDRLFDPGRFHFVASRLRIRA